MEILESPTLKKVKERGQLLPFFRYFPPFHDPKDFVSRGQYYKTFFSDHPTNLADVPKQKSSGQKLPTSEKIHYNFSGQKNFRKIYFGKSEKFVRRSEKFVGRYEKKFYSIGPWRTYSQSILRKFCSRFS